MAHHQNKRRPWDGIDGSDFIEFKEQVAQFGYDLMSKEKLNRDLKEIVEQSEFTWAGVNNIPPNFALELQQRFGKKKNMIRDMGKLWRRP